MTTHGRQPSRSALQGDIAIVGMGCLFPGAPDLETYWRNIVSKVDAISDPPADDWNPKIFYDPASKANDRVYCKRGGYIGNLAQFQPLDYGVMPATVDGGEPDQWLALRVAFAALKDAGYTVPPKEHVRTEVILGKGTYINRGNLTAGYHSSIIEYLLQVLRNLHPEYTETEVQAIKQEMKASLPPFNADTAPALIGNIIVGRVANRLDLMGPSFTVDAACASALFAVEIGMTNLLSYKCDLVLAGGANVNAPLPALSLFCQLGALSRKEQIRPFDKDADGTLLAEGLGMIVLKRLEDAERDGDRIYALLKGVGTASDGRALHVMAPRIEGEETALRRAYEMAGVSPRSVSLIEAHGTATPVGDAVEIQALRQVFGERDGLLPSCALGSIKSMIGHTMPAAGIAGLIKTALALYHRTLPPTLNCDKPDPKLELDRTPFYVNTETRPWIQANGTPRRAGVNAFGFGGANGHAVLEEYPGNETSAHNRLLHWETEVFILAADSRDGLFEVCGRLDSYLQQDAQVALKDLAYTLNSQLDRQPYRLAIVAASRKDLAQKLTHARGRIANPQCRQIKDNKGLYFFEEPINRQGKLAVMFPGEGAQYPNMLLDLCLHFPEVRACFDLADRVFVDHVRGYRPSDYIFPRATLEDPARSEMARRLWQIDGAVEGVLTANQAMWTLLSQLALRPDVIVGHSTGDYSAMFAAGVIDVAEEANYVETCLTWKNAHDRLARQASTPEASLVAVAADAAALAGLLEDLGDHIYLAMENCPHQSVIVGDKATVDQAVERLRNRGLIYEMLPFDRPYHTPLFQAYAEGAGAEFFSRLPLSAPAIPIYSCTTGALYPTDRDAIRKLYVAHWVKPVLFRQTIEKMYADGVRVFVEAGPRGNLTAFVDDILRGSPHLVIPSNVANRSGVTQLNHLVGMLAAQGIELNLDYLYARRAPQRLSLEAAPPSAKPKLAPMKLALGIPHPKVSPRQRPPAAIAPPQPATSLPAPAPAMPLRPSPSVRVEVAPPARVEVAAGPRPAPRRAPRRPAGAALALQAHLKSMESFLDVQQQVMQAFIGRLAAPDAGDAAPAARDFPLLGAITSLTPGQKLVALRRLDVAEDTFLREHALGGPVALTDPDLRPTMVVPLTMSMEILAEAAATLLPGRVLIGMRDIQAHHWIAVDEPVTLQITAQRLADGVDEVEVQVRNLGPEAGQEQVRVMPAIRGIMVLDDQYPAPPPAAAFQLRAARRSQLAGTALYDRRLMFHGPCFQGVTAVERSGEDGMTGQVRVLPPAGLFRSMTAPRFVTDPVVLDAVGQLVGFWAAEYLERGFVVFPYRLEALHIYGPNRPVGEHIDCRLKLQLLGGERTRSDFEVLDSNGGVWMHLYGWEDRRFDLPDRFHHFWVAPHEIQLSQPWRTPLQLLAGQESLECQRLEPLFETGNGFWWDLWASLVLNPAERRIFRDFKGPPTRAQEWLAGRTAAKEAVCAWLKRRYGLELLPADIEIGQDDYGRPMPGGAWNRGLPPVPSLALTHSNGVAVAMASDGSQRLGVDLEAMRELTPSFAGIAFAPEEQPLLSAIPTAHYTEWLLRLWCAKEAVAKALGRGLIEGPHSLRVASFELATGNVKLTPHGKLAEMFPEWRGADLAAHTAREGDYVIASTLL